MHFEGRYKKLNDNQRLAVDSIDGPVLVIAGPGTGKTELLSMRVANILKQTDTLPENILCLTFTENGAKNMRDRLYRLIGQPAYRINISTYHGFGAELINRFPEYFLETRMQEPIDELRRHQILSNIVEHMSYLNPLKQTRHHLGDLISTISDVKRALLSSDDLRFIASSNTLFIDRVSKDIEIIFDDWTRMPTKLDTARPYFEKLLDSIHKDNQKNINEEIYSLSYLAGDSLKTALSEATSINKTTPLTSWKNKWLVKNTKNKFILAGSLEARRIAALADVLDEYQHALEDQGLYDFDDMILRSIQSLENNSDLKYTLQEQYQYLLLDEFQDTNAVQLRLVQLLTDNPVNESKPNVLAVGDDDQAIYAFQGAQYSNMLDFYTMYRDVSVINLKENYRSHSDILTAAKNIAEQIDERLHHQFSTMTKDLISSNGKMPEKAQITRNEFQSDIAQYDWISHKINELITSGVNPGEIAILAPKHRHLEPIVPYLNKLSIPVSYEKRENILEAPIIKQIIAISRLILAVKTNNYKVADSLWPEVLSYDFWEIPTSTVWKLAWEVNDSSDTSYTWNKAVLKEEACYKVAHLILALAAQSSDESLETMLDAIIGTASIKTREERHQEITSPIRDFYTSREIMEHSPQLFYETLSHLKVLRERLRDFQRSFDQALTLTDFILFVDMHNEADQKIINTSPYKQSENAVQVMTVFKSKGLEFDHVFLVSCTDEVWGSGARGNTNKLTLPKNIQHIRHAGATDDERLRILFVALTRAKIGLHLTSYSQSYAGKPTKRLIYFNEQEHGDGLYRNHILPTSNNIVQPSDHIVPEIAVLDIDWHYKHVDSINVASLRALLEGRMQKYVLSPTHLNSFLAVDHGGPEVFFYRTILRFPEAPSAASQFGNAMHDTMEWIQHRVNLSSRVPDISDIISEFNKFLIKRKLPEIQESIERERGEKALIEYMRQRSNTFRSGDMAEENFANKGIFIGDAHIGGKIDKLEIDQKTKEITVVDYKTGKPYDKWTSDTKLHRYKQQLYFYKLLVEHTPKYKGYTVKAGRLEFLEPDESGAIVQLQLLFDAKGIERTNKLIRTVWSLVQDLNFLDTSAYDKTLAGIKEFENHLLTNDI